MSTVSIDNAKLDDIEYLLDRRDLAFSIKKKTIHLDFKCSTCLSPLAICFFTYLEDELLKLGKYPCFRWFDQSSRLVPQLKKAGLPIDEMKPNECRPFWRDSTLRPVTTFKVKFVNEYVKQLNDLFHLPDGISKAAHSIIHDLIMNIIQHSNSKKSNYLCADVKEGCNKLQICGLDTGIGILKSLQKSPKYCRLNNDLEAVGRCLEYGVSCLPDEDRGIGLYQIKRIILDNGGTLRIISGKSEAIIGPDKNLMLVPLVNKFEGTIVFVELINSPDFKPHFNDYEEGIEKW